MNQKNSSNAGLNANQTVASVAAVRAPFNASGCTRPFNKCRNIDDTSQTSIAPLATIGRAKSRLCNIHAPSWSWHPGPGVQSPITLPTKMTKTIAIPRTTANRHPNGRPARSQLLRDDNFIHRRLCQEATAFHPQRAFRSLAEEVGFEPTDGLPRRWFSRPVP